MSSSSRCRLTVSNRLNSLKIIPLLCIDVDRTRKIRAVGLYVSGAIFECAIDAKVVESVLPL